MCQTFQMTPGQMKLALPCSCKAGKDTLMLYSCCGSVNVLCSSCRNAGPRVSDSTKDGKDWMDETKGASRNRRTAIQKWNTLINGGLI